MKGKIFGSLFALLFFGVGVWMLWSISEDCLESFHMQSWVQVEAQLLRGGYDTHSGDDSNTYEAFAKYRYTYLGDSFVGTRVSLAVAIVSMASGTILGAWAGITSGLYGGLFDELMTRFVDVWNALPFLLIALVVSITVGQGVMIMMVLLIMLTWVGLVRNVRAEVLSLKTRDYVLAARVAGASDIRLMYKHILPGVSNLLLVLASLRVGGLILTEAALSFLGVGIPSRIPSWGQMISDGRDTLDEAWWISFFPGLGIFLTVMSMNFLGDWIRDRMDPRLRQLAD